MLRRRGLVRQDDSPADATDNADALESCLQLALTPGHRERHGRALALAPDEPAETPESLCATVAGVNVHAGVVVAANDREALTRLVRYLLRPPFSVRRFSLREDGAVVYALGKADRRGRTALILSPRELLARLAAILPAPRFALRREIGVFAAGSPHRKKLVTATAPRATCHFSPRRPPSNAVPSSAEGKLPVAPTPTRVPWAELLRRVFDIDALRCSRCEGRMAPVALVEEPAEAERYLRARGLYFPLHPAARSRGPPSRPC
jgi:hypothetical protein